MKIKAMFLMAVICTMISASCFAQSSPDACMNKICNAVLYLDEKDLKDFNIAPEEIRGMYAGLFENRNDEIKFTNKQANLIADTLVTEMQKKVKFDVKTESVNSNQAVVNVTITGINFGEVVNNILLNVENENAKNLNEILTNEIVKSIKSAQQKTPVTLKFNCEYDDNSDLWIPDGGSDDNLTPLFNAALDLK